MTLSECVTHLPCPLLHIVLVYFSLSLSLSLLPSLTISLSLNLSISLWLFLPCPSRLPQGLRHRESSSSWLCQSPYIGVPSKGAPQSPSPSITFSDSSASLTQRKAKVSLSVHPYLQPYLHPSVCPFVYDLSMTPCDVGWDPWSYLLGSGGNNAQEHAWL